MTLAQREDQRKQIQQRASDKGSKKICVNKLLVSEMTLRCANLIKHHKTVKWNRDRKIFFCCRLKDKKETREFLFILSH